MSSKRGCKRQRMDKPGSAEIPSNAPGNIFRSFPILPDEITMSILDHLDILTKIRLRRVCKKWNGILREDSMLRTIELDESVIRNIRGWGNDHDPSCESLFDKVAEAGAWKSLRHLIFIGCYDICNQEPHSHWRPVERSAIFRDLMYSIRQSKPNQNMDLRNLETFEVRRTAVHVLDFDWDEKSTALTCKLILSSSSIIFEIIDYGGEYDIEFEVAGCRCFELSGNRVELDYYPSPLLPVEIAQFVVEQSESAPPEKVSQLGELYSVLLKGRTGMVIRDEIKRMFYRICYIDEGIPKEEYDPVLPLWRQLKNYNFEELDEIHKYALLYYSRPRNCYQLATQGSEDVHDLSEL